MLIAGLAFVTGIAAASPGIQTVMGDDVVLSGYSTSGPYVYLFLTGPNLPENGVALHKPAIFSGSMFGALHAIRNTGPRPLVFLCCCAPP